MWNYRQADAFRERERKNGRLSKDIPRIFLSKNDIFRKQMFISIYKAVKRPIIKSLILNALIR